MKHLYPVILCLILCMLSISTSSAQNATAERVYNILQANCATSGCHTNATQAANLDLEGSGATLNDKIQAVRDALVGVTPDNAAATAKNYSLISPGDPQRSFLFRKINNGLQTDYTLDANEGDDMSYNLSNVEKELIRQWIFYGAPTTGEVVEESVLEMFYDGNAIHSFENPADRPSPPSASEGFQVHMGPFFLPPEGEVEYFLKYNTMIPDDQEITKIEVFFGEYSHHFLLYRFTGQNNIGYEPRYDADFNNSTLVTAHQYSGDITLPEGAAFFWDEGTELDLNSHYINYSSDNASACEVYMNIYTQPKGTAAQEMKVDLVANFTIAIPGDGQEHEFQWAHFRPFDNNTFYLWRLGSHTHQTGTDFDVYTRNSNGSFDDHIFDASHLEGDPLGAYVGYDYQHPPIRQWDDFIPIKWDEGLVFTTSYVNPGPDMLFWGNTSEDEMMLMVPFYLDDTTGVTIGSTTSIEDDLMAASEVAIYPNPSKGNSTIYLKSSDHSVASVRVYDVMGRSLLPAQVFPKGADRMDVELAGLPAGLYSIQLLNEQDEPLVSKKLIIE